MRSQANFTSKRDKAWSLFPFPCVGNFNFTTLSISDHPSYSKVVSALKSPWPTRTLLDLGCCFAQDLRKLAYDGIDSEQLYGSDIEGAYFNLGYELFADKAFMKAKFFAADIFADDDAWKDVEGKMDFIYIGSFLHLFTWDDQIRICRRLVRILKPAPGSIIFGRQTALLKAREVALYQDEEGAKTWRHDAESFKRMWDIISRKTGTKWKVWTELDIAEGMGSGHWAGSDMRRLRFEVVREEI